MPLRASRTPNFSCFSTRLISTTATLRGSLLRPLLTFRHWHSPILTQVSARPFSLSSLLSPRKVTQSPTPQTVAQIAAIEAEANAHPQDVAKQIALFEVLLGTNMKPGYEVLIARWERMCEFVRLLQNPRLQSHNFGLGPYEPASAVGRSIWTLPGSACQEWSGSVRQCCLSETRFLVDCRHRIDN